MYKKLPISIGILSWNSNDVLLNTLNSYVNNGLFDCVEKINIFFQEINEDKIKIAKDYNIGVVGSDKNIGVGKAFLELTKQSKTEYILLLEHDWELIEKDNLVYKRLETGIDLLKTYISCVRYRHRKFPGHPVYSINSYKNKELNHYDPVIDLISPHLLDCIYWIDNPEKKFSDKIIKLGEYYITSSRWANWTNNPCLYKRNFYINTIIDSLNDNDLLLESSISYWWARQNFKIAHGEGLFTHNDFIKYSI